MVNRSQWFLWISLFTLSGLLLTQSGLTPISLSDPTKTWTYPSGFDPHGGYIDRLKMVVYSSVNDALQDLQANTLFAYDSDIGLFSVLEPQPPNINVTTEIGTSFLLLGFDCRDFPGNITGYRRAIAYALDKYAVCELATNGYAEPLDGVISPDISSYSYESQMVEHYYSKDIEKANATLEACLFRDLDGDGWREYDTNNNSLWDPGIDVDDKGSTLWHFSCCLNIFVYLDPYSDPEEGFAEVLVESMIECGLRCEVIERDPYEFAEYPPEEAWCLTWYSPNWEEPHLLYDFYSGSWINSWINYNNPEYDVNVTLMRWAPTLLEFQELAWNCSKLLLQDMPAIVCCNNVITHAYRTGEWEGYVNMLGVNRMGNNPWSLSHVHLKEDAGGPFGCYPTEFICALTDGMDTTNVRKSTSRYRDRVFMNLYSRLWQMDPYTREAVPDLAYNWTIEQTEASGDIRVGQKFTFHLYENVSWHDGVPFTSQDVAFSLTSIWKNKTTMNAGFYKIYPVENIYHVTTPDEYTVEIYTNQTGYFEFRRVTRDYILPKHIWEPQLWNGTDSLLDWEPSILIELEGTGPFTWLTRSPGEYIILERNNLWHFRVEQSIRTHCASIIPWLPLIFIITGIIIIQLCILGGLLYRRRKKVDKFKLKE